MNIRIKHFMLLTLSCSFVILVGCGKQDAVSTADLSKSHLNTSGGKQKASTLDAKDLGGFDRDYPQSPNDPNRIIRIEIGQFKSRDAVVRAAMTMNESYAAIQMNKSGDAWRLITKAYFTAESYAQPHIKKLHDEYKFNSTRILSYSSEVDDQIVADVNRYVEIENRKVDERQAQQNVKANIDATCISMLKNKYEYMRSDRYTGQAVGRKFSDINLVTEYQLMGMSQNPVYPKYGANNVRVYNTVLDRVEGGQVTDRDIKGFVCIVNPNGRVMGVERD